MNYTIKICYALCIIAGLCISTAQASNFPLKIIQPQQNLDVNNRFYRAYPNLEYNVRPGVTGGNYPYRYSLTTAPNGMSISTTTGEITWPTPQESDTPYSVSLLVTDASGNTLSASWTVTVTTNGFYFVDASATVGGDGSLSKPWNNWDDFYLGRTDSRYENAFIYFREGTYTYPAHLTYTSSGNSNRLKLVTHPHVYLGYPNEAVTFDGEGTTNKIHLQLFGNDFYFDNIIFANSISYGLEVNSGDRLVVRRSTFKNFIIGENSDNNAAIGMKNDPVGPSRSIEYTPTTESNAYDMEKMYYLIQDNNFINNDLTGIGSYGITQGLYENNTFNNCGYSCITLKSTINRITVRGNSITTADGYSIVAVSQYYVAYADILHNYIKGGVLQFGAFTGDSGPIESHIHRNTIDGLFWLKGIESDDGPIYIKNNIVINDDPNNQIRDSSSEHYSIKDNSVIYSSDNLGGPASSGIIDSSGNLTSGYSSYIGSHGHMIGASPLPPQGLSVSK